MKGMGLALLAMVFGFLVLAVPAVRSGEACCPAVPKALKVVSVDVKALTIKTVALDAKDETGAKSVTVSKMAKITSGPKDKAETLTLDKIQAGSVVTMCCTCGKGCMDQIKLLTADEVKALKDGK